MFKTLLTSIVALAVVALGADLAATAVTAARTAHAVVGAFAGRA